MARPIGTTPTLKGESVKVFAEKMASQSYSVKKAEYLHKAHELYKEARARSALYIQKPGDK